MLGFEIQTRTALTYFESFSSWRELLYGSHEAGKQLYWVIAGKYFLLLKNSVCRTYNWIFRERNISGYDIWQKTHLLIKLYTEKTNEKWPSIQVSNLLSVGAIVECDSPNGRKGSSTFNIMFCDAVFLVYFSLT